MWANGLGMWRVWVRRVGCIGSWWGSRRERDHWGGLGVDENNIRMDLHEVGCGYMDWIGLAQDRDGWRTLVSAVMNLRVPWKAGNFLTSCKPVSFSRRTLHHGVSKWLHSDRAEQRCTRSICVSQMVVSNSTRLPAFLIVSWCLLPRWV